MLPPPLLVAAGSLPLALAARVCSPAACVDGKPGTSVLASSASGDSYIPGSYPMIQDPHVRLNQSIGYTGTGTTISPPLLPVAFGDAHYRGAVSAWDVAKWSISDWNSIYLSDHWYAILQPGQAVWGAVPNSRQFPGSVKSAAITSVASSLCSPACSRGGTCVSKDGSPPVCECRTGWAGSACESCASGFFGPTCSLCVGSCTLFDDGLQGSGKCIGTKTSSSTNCHCAHGTCTSNGDCVCAAGYTTNTTASTQRCATCAAGFFQDTQGNCAACPLGCTTCELQSGTLATPKCTSCVSGLSLSTATPATCVAGSAGCQDGQYWDSNASVCTSCSPGCTTCTGPSASDCLACASPRANLAGACVGYDASGKCDTSLSTLQGVFVVNNAKGRCDACPAGCLSCSISSYSPASAFDSLQCNACQQGYLLQGGRCVRSCGKGYYLPEGSAVNNGTCSQCDPACAECIGSATTCTRCVTGFAYQGACAASCGSGTMGQNGTCLSCHPDCATCSTPLSATACLTCPHTRPVLSDGRCIEHCPKTSFFDASSSSCRTCDSSCAACLGEGPAQCSLCPDGAVLKAGRCEPVSCDFATGLGVCLYELVQTTDTRWAAFVVLPVLVICGLGFWWYVRRERRKTRQATQAFAETLDDPTIRDRLTHLRLERVLGLNRVHIGGNGNPPTDPQSDKIKKAKERKKLRDLLLPSHRRRAAETEHIELGTKLKEAASNRLSAWMTPPPPYAPAEGGKAASSSEPTSSIATMHPRPSSISKDKIISADSPGIVNSFPVDSSLRPPPRPSARAPVEPERQVSRNSLRQLWPALQVQDEIDRLSEIDLLGNSDFSDQRSTRASRLNHGYI